LIDEITRSWRVQPKKQDASAPFFITTDLTDLTKKYESIDLIGKEINRLW
jgi:hypothetical protein